MAQSVLEQIGERIDETTHKASRAASAVADAVEDGVDTARRAAKRGTYAATELLDDTKRRVKLRPLEAVAMTFAAGLGVGAAIGLILGRKQS
jgi:ElaB/YqjD/DUF883 family membrane-anchored ribosome-binding protein